MARYDTALGATLDVPSSEISMLHVEFAQVSDAGLVRAHNEDYLGYVLPEGPDDARERGWLFALADGVGGHDRGEVASELAITSVVEGFRAALAGDSLVSVLPRLIQSANLRVYETAMSMGPGGTAMATTIVACALRFDRAVVAHVGDSRCYLIRHGRATTLTRDHTVPAEQLRLGLITASDAAKARTSHLLSRSVGTGMFLNVDTQEHQIFTSDVLLLCSDGLHNSIGEGDIARVVIDGVDLREAATALVGLAKQRDGGDNISVQLIRVAGVERVGMYRGRQYKIR